jgi:hypothetical protein
MKFKLAYPVSVYLLIFLAFGFFVLNRHSIATNTSGFLVYLILLVTAFYFFFSRYSCRVTLSDEGIMTVHYLMPWQKTVIVDLKKYTFYDFGRGFYGCSLSNTHGHFNLLRYSYDQLVLASDKTFQKDLKILKVNLRMGHFKKLLRYFKESANLQQANSDGAGGYFW